MDEDGYEDINDSVDICDAGGLQANDSSPPQDDDDDVMNEGLWSLAFQQFKTHFQQEISGIRMKMRTVEETEKTILKSIDALGTSVRTLMEPIADDLVCITCKEKRNCLLLPLTHFNFALLDANAVVPLVQMACIMTVASFAERVPYAQNFFGSELRNLFQAELGMLGTEGASGFSMLAYAKKKNAKRNVAPPAPGLLLSMFLRESMMRALIYARDNLFERRSAGDRQEVDARSSTINQADPARSKLQPVWLAAMQDSTAVRMCIGNIAESFEACETRTRTRSRRSRPTSMGSHSQASGNSTEGTPSLKRARLEVWRSSTARGPQSTSQIGNRARTEGREGQTRVSLAVNEDMWLGEEYRIAAIKKLRFAWNNILNHSRTQMRELIHLHMMFLQEFFEKNFMPAGAKGTNPDKELLKEGYAKAREDGYYYKFNDAHAAQELTVPIAVDGSRWDIPETFCGDDKQARDVAGGRVLGPSANMALFETMKKNYPCLKITLCYKVSIMRSPGDILSTRGNSARPIQNFFSREEPLFLHDLAQKLVIDRFRVKDDCCLLAISALSLRAIHIMAIALRALLRRRMGFKLNTVEEAALGDVEHRDVSAGESTVTTKLEEPTSNTGGGTATQSVARNKNVTKKMTMTFSEWQNYILPPPEPRAPSAPAIPPGAVDPSHSISVAVTQRDSNASWTMGKGGS